MTLPLLVIDTSGARLQLALAHGDAVITDIDPRERGHAEILFDRIAALLAGTGLAYEDLERIAVVTGPGSFSGLRIGLSAARGLGLALGIPVIGVPTLLGVSLSGPPDKPFAVLLDARRGEIYVQGFAVPGEPRDADVMLLPAAEAFARAGAVPAIGSAATAFAEATGASDLEAARPETERGFVDIAAVARFARSADPAHFPPVPAYVRDADAKPQQGARIARVGDAP